MTISSGEEDKPLPLKILKAGLAGKTVNLSLSQLSQLRQAMTGSSVKRRRRARRMITRLLRTLVSRADKQVFDYSSDSDDYRSDLDAKEKRRRQMK